MFDVSKLLIFREGVLIMVFVSKKKGESKDTLFRKFTRMFIEENVVDEVRKKLFYKKPSLLRKEKEKELLKSKRQPRYLTRSRSMKRRSRYP